MTFAARKVAVISGGPSSEAEVSRASGRAVAQALAAKGHAVTVLELDARVAELLRAGAFDVVFPITHGAVGEDGSLQGLLEVLGVAYVGSAVLSSAVAMDKPTAKLVFAARGLPLAKGRVYAPADGASLEIAKRARDEVGAALVVKPVASGSAIGVQRFAADADVAELARALDATFRLGESALVEAFVAGREVTCGVLDVGGRAVALPPTEIIAEKDAFYTYEARYAPGRSRHICPAALGEARVAQVQEIAVHAHRALGCRDLSRVDFVVADEGGEGSATGVTLLEVNTLPGFTATSLYPEAAAVAGYPLPELCALFIEEAYRRGPARRNAALALPT